MKFKIYTSKYSDNTYSAICESFPWRNNPLGSSGKTRKEAIENMKRLISLSLPNYRSLEMTEVDIGPETQSEKEFDLTNTCKNLLCHLRQHKG